MTARGQANLIGFAAAVVVVTTVTVAGVAIADDALGGADRDAEAAHAAAELAAHLVDGDAPHARAPNVVRRASVTELNASALDAAVPPVRGRAIRVSLGGTVLVERGAPDAPDERSAESARIERRVRVERDVPRTASVDLSERRRVELDEHAGRVTVTIEPSGRLVRTVRAGGRVVLHDPSGLDGRYDFSPPRTRPLAVEFESESPSSGSAAPPTSGLARHGAGTATVEWTATNASVRRLAVVVGA